MFSGGLQNGRQPPLRRKGLGNRPVGTHALWLDKQTSKKTNLGHTLKAASGYCCSRCKMYFGYFQLPFCKSFSSSSLDFFIWRQTCTHKSWHMQTWLPPPAWSPHELLPPGAAASCVPWCQHSTFSLTSLQASRTPRLGRSLSQAASTKTRPHRCASSLALVAPGLSSDAKMVELGMAFRTRRNQDKNSLQCSHIPWKMTNMMNEHRVM